jgi:hypothetical protein
MVQDFDMVRGVLDDGQSSRPDALAAFSRIEAEMERLREKNTELIESLGWWEANHMDEDDDQTIGMGTRRTGGMKHEYFDIGVVRGQQRRIAELEDKNERLRAILELMVRSTGGPDPLIERHLVRPSLRIWRRALQVLETVQPQPSWPDPVDHDA